LIGQLSDAVVFCLSNESVTQGFDQRSVDWAERCLKASGFLLSRLSDGDGVGEELDRFGHPSVRVPCGHWERLEKLALLLLDGTDNLPFVNSHQIRQERGLSGSQPKPSA
jgi:hypothetical protein